MSLRQQPDDIQRQLARVTAVCFPLAREVHGSLTLKKYAVAKKKKKKKKNDYLYPLSYLSFFARQAHLELAKSNRLPRRLFNTVKLGECSSVTYHVRIQSNLHPRVYGSIQVTCHGNGNVTVPFVAESCIWPSAAKSLCFPLHFHFSRDKRYQIDQAQFEFHFQR